MLIHDADFGIRRAEAVALGVEVGTGRKTRKLEWYKALRADGNEQAAVDEFALTREQEMAEEAMRNQR